MNILPKKRWHVRTRENIARVRRDEAKAAEEEKARKARVQKAETEARVDLLRRQRRENYDGRDQQKSQKDTQSGNEHEHINFFKDLEEGKIDHHKPNAEHEAEVKSEKEKYEKQIGYLTYLGQDTNEATGAKCWYEELPERLKDSEPKKEAHEKKKIVNDPMNDIKRYLNLMSSSSKNDSSVKSSKKRKLESDSDNDSKRSSKRHKKEKKQSKKYNRNKEEIEEKEELDNSSSSIDKLRAERLLREQKEKLRTEALLAKLRGDPIPVVKDKQPKPVIRQKYNSQFCPEIARQNAEPTPRRR